MNDLVYLRTFNPNGKSDVTAWVAYVAGEIDPSGVDVVFGGRVKTQDEAMVTAALVLEDFIAQVARRLVVSQDPTLF